jgi:hypothetical protein
MQFNPKSCPNYAALRESRGALTLVIRNLERENNSEGPHWICVLLLLAEEHIAAQIRNHKAEIAIFKKEGE